MKTNERSPCPKWDGCNAPTCPLDPHFTNCQTQRGEAVCLWLREGMKPEGDSRIPEAILPKVRAALPVLLVHGGAVLRGKLLRASQMGSKVAQGRTRGHPHTVVRRSAHTSLPMATASKRGSLLTGDVP